MVDPNRYNIHKDKNGRLIAYDKVTKHNISYPRVVMEDYLGRPLLKNEEVHHVDGNPLNNEVSNLRVMSRRDHLKEHQRLHYQSKYFDSFATCQMCGAEFLWTAKQQKNFHDNKHTAERLGRQKNGPFCSPHCSGKFSSMMQYHKSN